MGRKPSGWTIRGAFRLGRGPRALRAAGSGSEASLGRTALAHAQTRQSAALWPVAGLGASTRALAPTVPTGQPFCPEDGPSALRSRAQAQCRLLLLPSKVGPFSLLFHPGDPLTPPAGSSGLVLGHGALPFPLRPHFSPISRTAVGGGGGSGPPREHGVGSPSRLGHPPSRLVPSPI